MLAAILDAQTLLRLLLGLILLLLALLLLKLASLASHRFRSERGARSERRNNYSDDQFPLHHADVTTFDLNSK